MRTITTCRSCDSSKLTDILDLGTQYTSDFRKDDSKPPAYPIEAVICEDCMLVQLRHTTPSHEMYHENYGFKSGVSDSIKADLKDVVSNALKYIPEPKYWLDIASNDGTLLSYVPDTTYRVGCDPITKLCKEAETKADRIVNDFFNSDTVEREFDAGKYDVVTSVSCFYDMDEPNDFVSAVKSVLAKDGAWIIQQNYLLPTLQLNAVDNFCHEHLEYYTLLSLEPLLERHGLEVIDLSTSMVNGGSIRTIVAHKGIKPVNESVVAQRAIEAEAGLHSFAAYEQFAVDVTKQIKDLKALVDHLNSLGKSIYILAASTRGATIWQAAGITEKDCPFAVERNPAKVGRYFSACGMPIISEEEAFMHKPDYMIIGPWFFADEIIDREQAYLAAGGKLISPLPKLEIIGE